MSRKDNKTTFKLTPTERRVLDLYRSGMSYREIENSLGRKLCASSVLVSAIDKERAQALDDRRGRQDTSLKRSRGYTTQSGDPI